jgi:hypothetical protein
MRTTLIVVAVLLLAAGVGPAASAAEAPTPDRHPDVGETTKTCDGCHAEVTPEIYRAWYASAHGVNSVKCFVCHGARTERFAVQASIDRCAACHSDQIPAMEAFSRFVGKETSSCFECHPPHWLSPHAWKAREAEAMEESADMEKGGSR